MAIFYKMQANGNDFVVLPVNFSVDPCSSVIVDVCHRRFGIGCDQLLMICPPQKEHHLFFCRIFNADGTEAFHCGNGARCVARYVFEKLSPGRKKIYFQMGSNDVDAELMPSGEIMVSMGVPVFLSDALYEFPSAIERWWPVIRLSLGNPHAIIFNQHLSFELVSYVGPQLIAVIDPINGINVSFCDVVSDHEVRLVTFERGSGLTTGCGSASCSAVAAGIRVGLLSTSVRVNLCEGHVNVTWPNANDSVCLIGDAHFSFEGNFPDRWSSDFSV